MSVFSRAKKYSKSSLELEEKIKLLEKEEKKNIKEVTMSTGGMYSIVEPVPEEPPVDPTYDDVPDPNNWANGGTQTNDGGDANDPATWDAGWNNTTDMVNPNELTGETNRPIPVTPDLSGWNGSSVSVNNLGSGGYCGVAAWTISSGMGGGLAIGTVDNTNHFVQILVPSNHGSTYNYPADQSGWMTGGYYGGYSDAEFAAAQNIAVAYEGNKDNGAVARDVWVNYDTATSHGGPSYAAYTGVKKQTVRSSDGYIMYWKLKTISILKGGNSYEKTPFIPHVPAWNRVLQTNALGDGNDPENFPGAIEVSGRLFKKSKEALATMLKDDPQVAAVYGKKTKTDWFGDFMDQRNEYMQNNPGKGETLPKGRGMGDRFKVDAGGNDSNIAQFPTQDLGGLGAKDGDMISWGKKDTGPATTKNRAGANAASMLINFGGDTTEFEKKYGVTPQEYMQLPQAGYQSSKKGKQKVIATSYAPDGHVIYEGSKMYDFDKDPLVKKSDAFGNKEGQTTWFKAKDIKPEYPKKKPPKLKKGWHPKSPWHEMSDRAKKIKVSSQDLIRNYKVSTTEIAQYHALVDIINKFIDDNPDRADYIAQRYPYSDPRLAELNFKLDRMMDASEKYVESKFPENEKVTSRIVKIMKKNVELTDPKTFKMDPTPPTQLDYNKLKLRETATKHFKKPIQLKSWHKGHLTNA